MGGDDGDNEAAVGQKSECILRVDSADLFDIDLDLQDLIDDLRDPEVVAILRASLASSKLRKQQQEPETDKWKRTMAIFLVIVSGCCFTGANVLQKLVRPKLCSWTLLFHRSLMQCLVAICWLKARKVSLLVTKEARVWLCAQGVSGGIMLLTLYVAVKHLTLGSASAIFFSTPVFTFILAPIFLSGEFFGIFRLLVAVMLTLSTVLITRPEFIFHDPCIAHVQGNDVYLLVAIISPAFNALMGIFTTKSHRCETPLIVFHFAVGALAVSVLGMAFAVPPSDLSAIYALSPGQWASTGGIVALGIMANVACTQAYKWMKPTKVNVVGSFEVALNYYLQFYVAGDTEAHFYPLAVVGLVLLLFGIAVHTFEKGIVSKVNSPIFGKVH